MVRLVLADGQHMGVVDRDEAIQRARESELDLVEVDPDSDPPVCKLMDFGKFKYRQKKRESHKHHKPQLKEMRIGIATGEHDLNFKADQIREFLAEHHKVLVSMRLSGREKAHRDIALAHMQAFVSRFEELGKLERPPRWESSYRVSALLTPK